MNEEDLIAQQHQEFSSQAHLEMEDVFLNDRNVEMTEMDEKEFDMQQAALEAGKYVAENAAVATTGPHDSELAQKYENNRTLEDDQIRNFWYSKNELSQSFSSNHSNKNAEEIFKLFSSGAKKDDWHASMAESCAYRDMVKRHKVESTDTTVPNFDIITAQHKVEVALFDVYKEQMQGKEPDTSDLETAYAGYEKVTERAARKERIAQRAADRELEPGSVSTRDTSKYRSPHAQVKHVDASQLETSLKQANRVSNFKGKIESLRSQYNQ